MISKTTNTDPYTGIAADGGSAGISTGSIIGDGGSGCIGDGGSAFVGDGGVACIETWGGN